MTTISIRKRGREESSVEEEDLLARTINKAKGLVLHEEVMDDQMANKPQEGNWENLMERGAAIPSEVRGKPIVDGPGLNNLGQCENREAKHVSYKETLIGFNGD